MEILNDPQLLKKYIDQYHLQDYVTEDLMKMAELTRFETGEFIAREGGQSPYFHFLVQGECICYVYTCTGRVHCEAYMRALDVLGAAATVWSEDVFNDVETLTSCLCISINAKKYERVLMNDLKFLRFIGHWMARHIRESSTHRDPLEIRIAKFILKVEKNSVFSFNLSQCTDILETSYRHLLRVLKQLCDSGILEKAEKGYSLIDKARLEQIACGEWNLPS
jgi:CRP/FNR family transcriptional regulator, putaive post-exponential-phase nitrogen-starvation regulator